MKKGSNMTWLIFALSTVACWGLYGILLHSGQVSMGDPVNGRYKAFLFVGIAYFLIAVLAPLMALMMNNTDWHFPFKGASLSLLAGVVGAWPAVAIRSGVRGQTSTNGHDFVRSLMSTRR